MRFPLLSAAGRLSALPGSPAVVAGVAALTTAVAVTAVIVVEPPAAGPGVPRTLPSLEASASPAAPDQAETPAPDPATLGRAEVPVAVKELEQRLRPDVLVTVPTALPPTASEQLAQLGPEGRVVAFRSGAVSIADQPVAAVGVDPSTFRAFTAEGTAEATSVWQAVARGEAVASHEWANAAGLQLGSTIDVVPAGGGAPVPLRLGAVATTGVPGSDLVVSESIGEQLALPPGTGVLVSAPEGTDPVVLAGQVREVAGDGAEVDVLSTPAASPVAFLTGSKAAKAFGAFSYRYFPDGTIAPDAAWVKENIATTTLPIMGRVTCHRLMIPQLRGALQEVQDAGLGQLLRTYDGCYVPRFIARNPDNSVSLHTWGIAIDMDASTNYRGIRGTMDIRIVEIFKRWGFRWGGDWKFTDPMHFELGALLTEPEG